MFNATSRNDLGLLILRLGLGAIFLYQGSEKITRADTKWGSEWHYTGPPLRAPFGGMMNPPPRPEHLPAAVQLTVSWGQVVCGLSLVLGVLTRWAAAALIVLRLGAIVIFTFQDHFSFPEGRGYGENLAVLVMCVALILLGGGNLALDQLTRSKSKV
jgi:uncharacterized membrane protein YphA (DoxX/SURF4 family)